MAKLCTLKSCLPEAARLKDERPELFRNVLFLIEDMRAYDSNEQAQARVNHTSPLQDGTPLFFNDNYFPSPEDASYLSKLKTKDGKGVGEAIKALEHGKAAKGSKPSCTSHDIAPILQEAFDVPHRFQESRSFKDAYKTFDKEWRKKQKKWGTVL